MIPTPPPTFSAPVKVLEDEVSFEIYTADAIVIRPLAFPMLIAVVAAPPMLSVRAFVFIKLNAVLVLLVVKSPERLIPPPTANIFPIPTPPFTTRAPAVLEVVSRESFIVTGQYPALGVANAEPYCVAPPKTIEPLFT